MNFKYFPNYLWKKAGDRHHMQRLTRMVASSEEDSVGVYACMALSLSQIIHRTIFFSPAKLIEVDELTCFGINFFYVSKHGLPKFSAISEFLRLTVSMNINIHNTIVIFHTTTLY